MTRIAKHTPGPWHIGYRGMDICCTNAKIGGHAKLFDVRGWGYLTGNGHGGLGLKEDEAIAVQEANALLVAAAPDLLEALIAAKKVCDVAATMTSCRSDDDFVWSAQAKIDAAIAKATGGQ